MSKKKNKVSVYITSAINAKFSIYNPDQRLQQTLSTIDSVRKNIPNSEISVVEVSVPPVSADVEKQLLDQIDHYVAVGADSTVAWITENIDRQDVVKNLSEAIALRKLATVAQDKGWFDNSSRIFKISGRYWINENFNLQTHLNPAVADKFLFRKKNLSQFRPEHTGVPLQLQTRLYSYDLTQLPRYIELLDQMIQQQQDYYNQNRYIDIEHLWYKLLNKSEYLELDRIGVSGFIAPNGQAVTD